MALYRINCSLGVRATCLEHPIIYAAISQAVRPRVNTLFYSEIDMQNQQQPLVPAPAELKSIVEELKRNIDIAHKNYFILKNFQSRLKAKDGEDSFKLENLQTEIKKFYVDKDKLNQQDRAKLNSLNNDFKESLKNQLEKVAQGPKNEFYSANLRGNEKANADEYKKDFDGRLGKILHEFKQIANSQTSLEPAIIEHLTNKLDEISQDDSPVDEYLKFIEDGLQDLPQLNAPDNLTDNQKILLRQKNEELMTHKLAYESRLSELEASLQTVRDLQQAASRMSGWKKLSLGEQGEIVGQIHDNSIQRRDVKSDKDLLTYAEFSQLAELLEKISKNINKEFSKNDRNRESYFRYNPDTGQISASDKETFIKGLKELAKEMKNDPLFASTQGLEIYSTKNKNAMAYIDKNFNVKDPYGLDLSKDNLKSTGIDLTIAQRKAYYEESVTNSEWYGKDRVDPDAKSPSINVKP